MSYRRCSRKAEEYVRLLDIRGGSSTLSALALTGSCISVICIDLAARTMGATIDKKLAAKFAGVNKKAYSTGYKTLEHMLDLQPHISIHSLAVQFGCTNATALARQVLQRYSLEFSEKLTAAQKEDMDFTRPVFQAAALSAACRQLKTKLDRSKLMEVSGVKKVEFDQLQTEMSKYANMIQADQKAPKGKRNRSFIEELGLSFQDDDFVSDAKVTKVEEAKEADDSDYEEWKRRILEEADKALGNS
ncbi:origin recognition complex subunit 6-like [Lingula anatina]|uniref:Origin recognition complex subunit 6 n=1 Tax=Lingula anatina TaxID=7574 RepID=A0A1S3JGQ6_LINAN|nr:origin recognition complex subunit 6-like [Lingula anatina]|eukprot:XP_013409590.1 origin recognition complex subunit 6-like [Lingula anatina]